jgi:hypothetical protein
MKREQGVEYSLRQKAEVFRANVKRKNGRVFAIH